MVITAHKGRRAEHKTRRILALAGFESARSAGSKGKVDVIAWNQTSVRLIQVKAGAAAMYISPVEYEALKSVVRPPNSTVELWRFPDHCREPLIEVL